LKRREYVRMKKILLALLTMFIAITAILPASAHNSMVYPSKTTAAVGEEIELVGSMSAPFGEPDLPYFTSEKIGYTSGNLKMAAFRDGKTTDMPLSYAHIKDGQRKVYGSAAEVEEAFLEDQASHPNDSIYTIMRRVLNCSVGSFKIDSEKTTAFATATSFTLYSGWTFSDQGDIVTFAKTFVNLSPDGQSTKPLASHFGSNILELVPVEDLASVKPGGTFHVKALVEGKAQRGIVVYIGYKGLPESEYVSMLYLTGAEQPAMYVGVTDADGIVELPMPEIPTGADELHDVYIFSEGDLETTRNGEWFIYRSTINFSLSKEPTKSPSGGSSGGCNSGFPMIFILSSLGLILGNRSSYQKNRRPKG
jgi:hypothetical protein